MSNDESSPNVDFGPWSDNHGKFALGHLWPEVRVRFADAPWNRAAGFIDNEPSAMVPPRSQSTIRVGIDHEGLLNGELNLPGGRILLGFVARSDAWRSASHSLGVCSRSPFS